MIAILAPAKKLEFEGAPKTKQHTKPDFLDHSEKLVNLLKNYSPDQLSSLMKISGKLANLNYDRFQEWARPFTSANAKQAILCFKGDTYTGLKAETFNEDDFGFAQDHVRILSGLYGILRPLDLIQPYRLEMGTKLETSKGKDLYEYWGDRLTEHLNKSFTKAGNNILINLASQEYFKSINTEKLNGTVITPVFKDYKNGAYKVFGLLAKRARGMMTRFMVKNRITNPDQLKTFDEDGYYYSDRMSNEFEWVFTRG
ncbi:MAG: peroxide stress protein YaaA [Bacteroidales bacterium]|nr:peroxide stress protein YaaA [Bacteroidales bacterium]